MATLQISNWWDPRFCNVLGDDRLILEAASYRCMLAGRCPDGTCEHRVNFVARQLAESGVRHEWRSSTFGRHSVIIQDPEIRELKYWSLRCGYLKNLLGCEVGLIYAHDDYSWLK